MHRSLMSVALAFGLATASLAQKSDGDKLQGTWEITALIEDDAIVTDELLRTGYVQDARLTISGQSISFTKPGKLQKRSILYVLDDKASPKTVDLAGAEKTSGKGIYLLSDDVLMICLGEPEAKQRPTEFSAKKGSSNLLMTLKRLDASKIKPTAEPKETAAAPKKDDELQKELLGTWGHQSDNWVTLFSLNNDGTFSTKRDYKKKLGKLFNEDVRSSGTWKLKDGLVLCTITASTEKDMIDQVYSYRIRSISETELIAVDQFGSLRREWKVK